LSRLEASLPAQREARRFYGWVIVAVTGSVGALSMALGTLNFGLFIKPMGDELGIARTTDRCGRSYFSIHM